jgi:hypothetical protein
LVFIRQHGFLLGQIGGDGFLSHGTFSVSQN